MSNRVHSVPACFVILILTIAASGLAQSSGGGGGGGSTLNPPVNSPCDSLVRSCADMTDDELFAAAFLNTSRNPHSLLGTCYFHDDSACPTCACPFYVKLSYLPSPSGYDGGTGCLQTREEVLAVLRHLCSTGQCGCPQQSYSGNCIQVFRYGKDPATGTCCQYPTPCNVPTGWAQFNSLQECQQ
jgi:hypothetical protein